MRVRKMLTNKKRSRVHRKQSKIHLSHTSDAVAIVVRIRRFFLPVVFGISGFLLASYVITLLAKNIAVFSTDYDMIDIIPGNVASDVPVLLGLSSIAGIIVYLFLALPIAILILIFTKIIRATAYDVDIAQIGNRFGGLRMIRRALVPALFAVALSGIVMQIVEGYLFRVLDTVPPQVELIYNFLGPVIGALVTLPLVLAIFAPTWLLNDSGIVMHLKPEQLSIRRCPDTIGVGRWVNNMLAGFTILILPIASFAEHFLPLIRSGVSEVLPYFMAFFFSFGVPFITMAFTIPVIIFNEIMLGLMRKPIRRVAKAFGARELRIETVITETEIVDEEPEAEYGWGLKGTMSE